MEPLPLNEVAEAVRGELYPPQAGEGFVKEISTDSRTLPPGSLFVPLKGENFDGHEFMGQARARGAAACLSEQDPDPKEGMPVVKVKSTLGAFMHLARYYREKFEIPVVGITGSNGKTTTKDLLGQILSEAGPTVYSERSFNNFVGLPITIFRIEKDTQYAVLEMGTNTSGEIAALADVAAPEVGIVTNISQSHLEGLRDLNGIAREKAALLAGLKGRCLAVLNRDDPAFDLLAGSTPGRIVTFGICHRSDYTAIQVQVDMEGVSFEVGGMRVRLSLLGVHNIYNALAAFACASELGVPSDRIASMFERFKGPPMRLKPVRKGSLLVINDTYNANPGSMESAIKTFSVLPTEGRKVVVLGDMLELGDASRDLHEQVGRQLSCGEFHLVAAVGVRAQDYLEGAKQHGISKGRLVSFTDTKEAVESLPPMLKPQDSVLVKGSRKMELEKLVDAVLERGI